MNRTPLKRKPFRSRPKRTAPTESIMQTEDECYLCGANGSGDPLDEHHVFNAALRQKSEQYGLKVKLCHSKCHIFGKDSVHVNQAVDDKLKQLGQAAAMHYYGWDIDEWHRIFGKSYL